MRHIIFPWWDIILVEWKISYEAKDEAPGTSSTFGASIGHFNFLDVVVDGALNFNGAIVCVTSSFTFSESIML
jgi:hypothetical protein